MKSRLIILFLLFLINCNLAHNYEQNLVYGNSNSSSPFFTELAKNSDNHYHFFAGVNAGYANHLQRLKSNAYFGLLIEIPMSQLLSLQPELNFWKTERKNPLYNENITLIDFPVLLKLKIDQERTGFYFNIGLGMMFENNSNNKLLSFIIGGGYWWKISDLFRLFLQSRVQTAGSLEAGGGSSFTSLIIGTGIQIQITQRKQKGK